MNDLLEIKESLIKHLHLENSRANLYGDEINTHNGKRNEYRCKKCGVYKWIT